MILELLILACAIPVGFVIAWFARDELTEGRKWFRILVIASILFGIWFYLIGMIPEMYGSLFVGIVSFVSFVKSYNRRWTANRKV